MATIDLPDDVLADAQRGAEKDGVDVRTWIVRAITHTAPIDLTDEPFPYDDGGFPIVARPVRSAA